MIESNKRPLVIERFYEALDGKTDTELTSEQRLAVEQAVLSITASSMHWVDVRKSFPFLNRRYYFVFLFGLDHRKRPRKESTLFRILLTALILFSGLFCTFATLLTLYMIKSALGIDIFPHFHLGIWDWWLSLKDH
ncbi:hypothetical protein F6Q07_18270 [Pectobacterium parmentieri]|uniref:EpsP n=1 Tax=Pectobacterium parmentieri TaxID=1905730 RepID=A0A0H3I2C7_PECPM|nr:hypothetical protein [Pectobacterium parmentieri]ACX86421.1 conserved hypothetical protein [Pectobacterium parmentieri WPP163]AFI88737.1 EpsP [Pectobacterium parmentieri]AOR60273.1 hypothetical protein A8F97_15425 [Pectobacterium parmentieri]AYH00013.1 hypothetical protein C5E26_03075 [Pectobacterium parmentieri]AYH04491.1 hypothetical protein C5E25_03435 [Pectobacterium parmentieri]